MSRKRHHKAPGRLATAAALALCVAGAGCRGDSDPPAGSPPPSPPPSAAGPAALELVAAEAQEFTFGPLPVGTFVAYGLSTGAVHQPLTVVDVQPLTRSDNVEFVGSRLAFYVCARCHRRPGEFGVRTLLGATCGTRQPANRALGEAAGRRLEPNDAPHLIIVGRVTGRGDAHIGGARVTYRVGTTEHVVETPVHRVRVRADVPPADPPCPDPAKTSWFGGPAAARDTAPLG